MNRVVPSRRPRSSRASTVAFGQRQRLSGAAVGLNGGARSVGGQFQDRRNARELFLPVLKLRVEDFALQPLPLPYREVRILDGKLRKRNRLSLLKTLRRELRVRGKVCPVTNRPPRCDAVTKRKMCSSGSSFSKVARIIKSEERLNGRCASSRSSL